MPARQVITLLTDLGTTDASTGPGVLHARRRREAIGVERIEEPGREDQPGGAHTEPDEQYGSRPRCIASSVELGPGMRFVAP